MAVGVAASGKVEREQGNVLECAASRASILLETDDHSSPFGLVCSDLDGPYGPYQACEPETVGSYSRRHARNDGLLNFNTVGSHGIA